MRKILLATLLSGCFAHMPMHTTEHFKVEWRSDYATALADAQQLGRPVLVVMIAGEKDGAICLGGDYLRSSALTDARVIERINRDFVPVWINVRTTPLPAFPFLKDVLVTATVDGERRVTDLFSRNYFLRSVIVSSDGQRLLNPGASTVSGTAKSLIFEGDFSYETNDPDSYLSMLKHALARR
jgi:hypothetical protein